MKNKLFEPRPVTYNIERFQSRSRHGALLRRNLRLASWEDHISDALVVQLDAIVASWVKARFVRVPRTWWDHFKERWFPAWCLNRWPVRYREFDAKVLLPTVPVPEGRDRIHAYCGFWEVDE